MCKKLLKSVLSLFIAVILALNVSVVAFADDTRESGENISFGTIEPISFENNTYFAEIDYDADNYVTDQNKISRILRSTMVAGDSKVTIKYATEVLLDTATFGELVSDWFDNAFAETDKSYEGSYLYCKFRGYATDVVKYWQRDGIQYYTIPFTIEYFTTKQQEEDVSRKIDEVIESFGFTNATTEKQKCDKIYSYITSNVTYDYENLTDENYTLKFTAYAALVNKTAVCQGFASLFYRFAKECGLKTCVITGTSFGQPHAWNIVKVGGYYYFLDSTWDSGKTDYDYYLIGSDGFSDHVLDDKFKTDDFKRTYPISKTVYTSNGLNESCQAGHDYEQYYENQIEICYTCVVCGTIKTESKLPMGQTLVKDDNGDWLYYFDGVRKYDTTLVKYKGIWFYIKDGVWDRNNLMLFKYKGEWFFIQNGKWNRKATVLFEIEDEIFYIKNGKWSKKITTLVKYSGVWIYIKNGKWNESKAIVEYGGKKFYVNDGCVQFGYSGNVKIGGKTYKIKRGKVA